MPVIAILCIAGAGFAVTFPKTSLVMVLLTTTFFGFRSLPRGKAIGNTADLAKSAYVAESSTLSESWSWSD